MHTHLSRCVIQRCLPSYNYKMSLSLILFLVLKPNLFDIYNLTTLGCQFGLMCFLALVSLDNQDVS